MEAATLSHDVAPVGSLAGVVAAAVLISTLSRNGFSAFISTNTLAKSNLPDPLAKPNLEMALIPLTFQASRGTLNIIVLSSDSEDINEGPSKGKVPKEDINEGPSKGKLPPLGSSARPRPEVGPELAKLFNPEKETKDKSSMDTFPGSTDEETSDTESTNKNIIVGTTGKNILSYEDTIEKYVPVVKSASKKAIFKSPQIITGVVLGLANLKTWDDIVKK
ncbi:hypothetical protein Tco_0622339 [Tanacetum coccineum]